MNTWQLQEAKNKLSELVETVLQGGGPQMITRHGKPAAVMISVEDYEKAHPGQEKDFVEFLLSMPKAPEEWFEDGDDPFPRINDTMRDIDL